MKLILSALLLSGCAVYPPERAILVHAFIDDGVLVIRANWEESAARCVEAQGRIKEYADLKRFPAYEMKCIRAIIPGEPAGMP